MWRGRAYSIIGQKDEALADFRRAEIHGVGPQRYLAASMRSSLEGNGKKVNRGITKCSKSISKCGEAWSEIGFAQFSSKAHDDGITNTYKSYRFGESEHRCNIINKNIPEATTRFDRAKELNPKLVQWGNFAEFKQDVVSNFYKSDTSVGKRYHGEETAAVESQFSKVTISNRGVSGRQGGGGNNGGGNRGGGGGNGGGNGGGDDDEYVWKKFRKTSKITKKHDDGRQFKRVGSSKYWLSRDKAVHAGSFFKVFIEKGNTLDFIGSVPIRIFHTKVIMDESYLSRILHEGPELEDFNLIPKLESHKGEQINMKDLHGV
ncbi:unnamed protein product [Mytilus edulis]|uniref:Uncharacterized protein n=1 Tax=Mytilus edulis TaxID=6550 RepID=A0A8S3T4B7_MYTED|nr:unnamed protein product [Mytilus edulis]